MIDSTKNCVGVVILGLFFYSMFTSSVNTEKTRINDVDKQTFRNYLVKFDKNYSDQIEYDRRFRIFKKALRDIENMNLKRRSKNSAIYGLTQFSDMSQEEFLNIISSTHKTKIRENNEEMNKQNYPIFLRQKRDLPPSGKVPTKIDWRKINYVSGVKNQKNCGACWAFSVISVVETMSSLKHNKSENLSVQQMIDCSKYGNYGCEGGEMCALLRWLTEYKVAIETELEYPLQLRNHQQCQMTGNGSGVYVDRYICQRLVDDEEMILKLLALHGPLAVSINALTWQNYVKGVIQFHCSGSLNFTNHAVELVGYDLEHEIPHYIVRNSWGKTFGDDGYLYIATNGNICGIANEVIALSVL